MASWSSQVLDVDPMVPPLGGREKPVGQDLLGARSQTDRNSPSRQPPAWPPWLAGPSPAPASGPVRPRPACAEDGTRRGEKQALSDERCCRTVALRLHLPRSPARHRPERSSRWQAPPVRLARSSIPASRAIARLRSCASDDPLRLIGHERTPERSGIAPRKKRADGHDPQCRGRERGRSPSHDHGIARRILLAIDPAYRTAQAGIAAVRDRMTPPLLNLSEVLGGQSSSDMPPDRHSGY
jgi:hypothetical protein